jgi:H+-transporting ATPase
LPTAATLDPVFQLRFASRAGAMDAAKDLPVRFDAVSDDRIIDGIAEARRIFERMTSYVLYRIAMTIAIMVFVVLASIYYHFFPLTAIMLIALALLDDVPIMTIAFDNATVPPQPVKWELDKVLVISSVLGLLGVIQSFGLLYLGDRVHHLDRPQLSWEQLKSPEERLVW